MTTHRNRLVTAISNAPGSAGALTVAAAQPGYRTFAAADDGLLFDVAIVDGTAWEVRTGCVYTHADTSLARGTLEDSSTGSDITLTSAAMVTVTLTAAQADSLAALAANTSGTNTGDQIIPSSAADVGAIALAEKGQPDGVATLDAGGLIPTTQAATGTPDLTKFLRGDRVWAVPGAAAGGGVGTLECYDAAGLRDDVPVAALSALDSLSVSAEMVIGSACDIFQNTSGNFGWRDNIQSFALKATANNAPTWGATIGTFEGYVWSASAINQAMVDFHIDHDYAMGTLLYPHVHFRPLTAGSGVVRWGFEFSVSKGHGQTVGLAASTTVFVNFPVVAGNLGTHYVAEVVQADAIPATEVEPDSVIHVRVFRDAANASDTYPGTVWAWQADLHYQFARLGTLNKAPNFYG